MGSNWSSFRIFCATMTPIIKVHRLSDDPTEAWDAMRPTQRVIKLNVTQPTSPAEPDKLRFVCMSDTHSLTSRLTVDVPDGDVLLHAGDFSRCGSHKEVEEFNTWLGTLPHKHKIVIAGNHELTFDPAFASGERKVVKVGGRMPVTGLELEAALSQDRDPRELLTNATYLQDRETWVAGLRIYGTPWQPEFFNWAFNLPRGKDCLRRWQAIPAGIDVLLSHSPPLGHGDLCCTGVRAGCVELLQTVQGRVKPKYHVFGHIHEGYGITTDGNIIYVNASTCDINYRPRNPPLVFDVPIPPGHQK